MNNTQKQRSRKSAKLDLTKQTRVVKKSTKPVRQALKAKGMAKEAQDVIKMVIMPGVQNNVRFRSAFTAGPTSVSNLQNPVGVRFPSAAGFTAYPLETRRSSVAFSFRDPVRSAVIYDGNPSAQIVEYDVRFVVPDANSVESLSNGYFGNAGPMQIAYAQPGTSCQFEAHGSMLGTGLANGKSYLWSQTNYTWASTGGPPSFAFRVFKWTPRGEVYIGEFTPSTLLNLNVNGYIRFEVYILNGNSDLVMTGIGETDAIGLRFTTTGPVFRQLSLPRYSSKVQDIEKIRTLSCGMLWTNLTPEIGKGGKMATKQLPGDEPWDEYALNGYDSIAKTIHADLREAKNGVYAFLKPTTMSDFEMTDNVDVELSSNEVIRYGFDLESVRSYIGTYVVLPDDDTQSAQFTALHSIEFESEDQWFSQDVSDIPVEVFDQAIAIIAQIPQYDENPLHVKDMLAAVKKYGKKALDAMVKYGPTAIEVASAIAALV